MFIIFVDLLKAFDTVDRSLSIEKLNEMNVKRRITNTIRRLLNNSKMVINIKTIKSNRDVP